MDIKGCVLVSGSFAGVRVPKTVQFFDVRMAEGEEGTPAPWEYQRANGESYRPLLWACERADVASGLKSKDFDHATMGLSCNTYLDHRKCSDAALADMVRSIRRELASQLRRYRKAKQNPVSRDKGGSIRYRPALVAIANYGWSITGDRRTEALTQATY